MDLSNGMFVRLSPEGVDVVLDCMCGEDTNKGISLLKPMGKHVLYGQFAVLSAAIVTTRPFPCFRKIFSENGRGVPIVVGCCYFANKKNISLLKL